MGEAIKVHMVGNAHLDPVWLWSWQAGVDEALATAYTAVKLLKEYPEFVFTRSDVWFHQTVETLNPDLFAEIRAFVEQGRWQIVGGWYIQPDCNLPTEHGFRKHIEVGQKYFADRFGRKTTVGYNVDSFGHAGTLPRLLAEAGYQSYVYMRPGTHEKEYPAPSQVFWWEAADSPHRLLAYRIPVAYCCTTESIEEFIPKVLAESDASLGHIMCFYGVGDHGGGPTRRQIEYIRENRTRFNGYELVFSHPQAYFDAVAGKTAGLPVVKGELQHHAVGCYSVLHRIKQELHRAEHRLVRARAVINAMADGAEPGVPDRIEQAWQDVLFNQFHDTYGGTCIKSAYGEIFDQISRAKADADREQTRAVRRFSQKLPRLALGEKDYLGYFAVLNPHAQEYAGWLEHEVWGLEDRNIKLFNVNGEGKKDLPYQKIRSECGCPWGRLLVPIRLAAGAHQMVGIKAGTPNSVETDLRVAHEQINSTSWQVKPRPTGLLLTAGGQPINLTWQVFEDLSDTWSHGKLRLGDRHLGAFTETRVMVEEYGPLRACLTWHGDFLHSRIRVRARVYREEPWIELLVTLFWAQPRHMVKMVLEPREHLVAQTAGAPGGVQPRDLDGKEYPFFDWIILTGRQNKLGVLSPDIFGYDAQKENVRFTLVRSPVYAFHDPAVFDEKYTSYDFVDQGEHEYRILLGSNGNIEIGNLQKIATQIQQPPIHWDPPYRENYPRG